MANVVEMFMNMTEEDKAILAALLQASAPTKGNQKKAAGKREPAKRDKEFKGVITHEQQSGPRGGWVAVSYSTTDGKNFDTYEEAKAHASEIYSATLPDETKTYRNGVKMVRKAGKVIYKYGRKSYSTYAEASEAASESESVKEFKLKNEARFYLKTLAREAKKKVVPADKYEATVDAMVAKKTSANTWETVFKAVKKEMKF